MLTIQGMQGYRVGVPQSPSWQRRHTARSLQYISTIPCASQLKRRSVLAAATSAANEQLEPPTNTSVDGQEQSQPPSIWQRLKNVFVGEKLTKERLAALGLGAVASYGFLSNLVYGTGMSVTWIIFVKQRGVSPLAPGQWPAYLAFYAGFWTINNFIRPFRFAVSVAMAPFFDSLLDKIRVAFGWKTKRSAFGVYVGLLGAATMLLTFGSIGLFAGPQAFARA